MNINDKIHGFTVKNISEVPEASATAYTLEHDKSGARLLYLASEDDNKVFSIAFRTPPTDDTGVAHIVEHSVLCGSRKYPLKEPFVELVKGSLNTFLNAMTYPDKTMYPVASRNDKDFQNLMDVYLDAVFYPAMRENPQVLMQEGWHYEIESAGDPLRYSGVVYNEMKGATSSADDMLENYIMHALYPDTTYGYESGGDPQAIPQLTQEGFIGFHSRYYHPSNSYIFLYGAMDIEEKLAYLDREYLSAFDRIEIDSAIRRQAPVAPATLHHEYPVGAGEDTAEKTFLALNWVVGDMLNMTDIFGLQVLEHALLSTESAPLRHALIDAKLGKDVDSKFETDLFQPFFSIVVAGSEASRAEEFKKLVYDTLAGYAREGLDKTMLEASLNRLEFRLREGDFGRIPKGLVYNIQALNTWLYDGEPEGGIRYEELLRTMKEGLAGDYFERLIEKYLLHNEHQVMIVMTPSTTFSAERDVKLADKLAAIKAKMTDDEIAAVIKSTRELKEAQARPDSEEALATIPLLKLSDIRKEAYRLPLEEREIAGTKVLFSDVATSGITYLDFYFDAHSVARDDIFYAYLLAELLGRVDTSAHSYSELSLLNNLHTGGLHPEVAVYSQASDLDALQPKFRISAKVLTAKIDKLFALLTDILTGTQFTDKKRIRELIEEKEAGIELSLQSVAHQVAINRVASYISPAAHYSDLGVLPFYHFLQDFLADFDASLERAQAAFTRILPQMFNCHALITSVTTTVDDYAAFASEYEKFVGVLERREYAPVDYDFQLEKKNEGLTSASQVQYVVQGANFRRLGYAYTGAMHVLETMLRYDFFWTKLRVQGGAYGAFTSFNQNGNMYFGSYRDPNLEETLAVYRATADYVRSAPLTERELTKYIIGTMSGIDMPLTPQQKGGAAASLYLRGITFADVQRQRDEILGATADSIHALGDIVAACMEENALCVFGGEAKINAAKAVFGTVKPAL